MGGLAASRPGRPRRPYGALLPGAVTNIPPHWHFRVTPGLPHFRNVQTRHPPHKDGTNEITTTRIPHDRHACSDDLSTQTVVSGMASGSCYEIRVQGTLLDRHRTAWFDGLQVSSDGSQTVICGPAADQAALHGLPNNVGGLGLVLISVHQLDPK